MLALAILFDLLGLLRRNNKQAKAIVENLVRENIETMARENARLGRISDAIMDDIEITTLEALSK